MLDLLLLDIAAPLYHIWREEREGGRNEEESEGGGEGKEERDEGEGGGERG